MSVGLLPGVRQGSVLPSLRFPLGREMDVLTRAVEEPMGAVRPSVGSAVPKKVAMSWAGWFFGEVGLSSFLVELGVGFGGAAFSASELRVKSLSQKMVS